MQCHKEIILEIYPLRFKFMMHRCAQVVVVCYLYIPAWPIYLFYWPNFFTLQELPAHWSKYQRGDNSVIVRLKFYFQHIILAPCLFYLFSDYKHHRVQSMYGYTGNDWLWQNYSGLCCRHAKNWVLEYLRWIIPNQFERKTY